MEDKNLVEFWNERKKESSCGRFVQFIDDVIRNAFLPHMDMNYST